MPSEPPGKPPLTGKTGQQKASSLPIKSSDTTLFGVFFFPSKFNFIVRLWVWGDCRKEKENYPSFYHPKVFLWLSGKESACNAGDLDLIPELGRSPGEGHGNPLQYSCLGNPYGQRSLVVYSPWGCKESDMTEQLSTQHRSDNSYIIHVSADVCDS